jgi:hypothetical protein
LFSIHNPQYHLRTAIKKAYVSCSLEFLIASSQNIADMQITSQVSWKNASRVKKKRDLGEFG